MIAPFYLFTCLAIVFPLFYLTKLFLEKKKKKGNGKEKNFPPSLPNAFPILGHLHLLKKPLHKSLLSLAAQHGHLFLLRFGSRPVLVISSAPLAEECFTDHDISFANRPMLPSFKLTSYNYSTFATVPYGAKWRDMRRISTTMLLSSQRLAHFSAVRANEVLSLARHLFRDSLDGSFKKVELRPRLFGLAMNIMMETMAGKRYYGTEDSGGDNSEAVRFKKIVEEGFALGGASNLGDFLPSLLGWLTRWKIENKLAENHSYRDKFLQAIIEERRRIIMEEEEKKGDEGEEGNKIMIDAILALQKTNPKDYNDNFIKALVAVILN